MYIFFCKIVQVELSVAAIFYTMSLQPVSSLPSLHVVRNVPNFLVIHLSTQKYIMQS